MKNLKWLLIVFVVIMFLSSCGMYYENYDVLIRDTILETNQNIAPKSDYPYTEYWQTSEETLKYKTGDCEDYVILCKDEIYKKYNIKTNIAVSIKGHALLEYMGTLYECTNKKTTYPKDKYLNSSYETIFFNNIDNEIKIRRF